MRSPAAAIAWEFRRRHRWGLAALAFYLTALAAIRLLLLGPGQRITFDNDLGFAFGVIVPLGSTFMYCLAVFSFGLAGDLGARRSIYPARMFTLPLTSTALAGWPMLYGSAAMAALWLATRLLALWPAGVDVPWIWPAVFAAVMLAWTQALTWMPYPLPGLRVIVTVLWLTLVGFVALLALHLSAPEPVMLALLAPQLPLAYLIARFAVTLARRGDVAGGRRRASRNGQIGQTGQTGQAARRGRGDFTSPARAQVWLEWRSHGRSLPALVGILLPFELALLFAFGNTPTLVLATLVAVLLTPVFLATFAAATVRRSNLGAGRRIGESSHALAPLLATRPLTDASLAGAKLAASAWSALAAWLLVLVATPLAIGLSGTSPLVLDIAQQAVELAGAPRATVTGLLALVALMTSTWKQLVQSLYIGMSGRPWLVRASVFVPLVLLTLFAFLVPEILRNLPRIIATLWNTLPWILTGLVGLKSVAAAWVAIRLHGSRLLSDRALVLGALSWAATVLGLYGLLIWLVPAMLVRGSLLALAAILAVPLARISAAPLTLSWNRHR